jgi:hypothetical protein
MVIIDLILLVIPAIVVQFLVSQMPADLDVVLAPNPNVNPTGSLVFVFFLRPNQLVRDSKAATVTGFSQTITVTNANISAGDSIRTGNTILTAVVGAPSTNQFQIGASDIATATNLVTGIATSWTDSTPVLAFTGQQPISQLGKGAFL